MEVVQIETEPTSTTFAMTHPTSPPLPKGAQPPQVRPRNDLPFDFLRRKNVLRRTSKSSSSTTVTTIASSASSSNNHNTVFVPSHVHTHSDYTNYMPSGPGSDPLLERLRYDLSFPPHIQQKPLPPPPVTEAEAQFINDFGVSDNSTHIRTSWSETGHSARQTAFSALFVSPSSSSSSSETGHHDPIYHHAPRHAYQHPNPPPIPLSYHLPSRRMRAAHPKSVVQFDSDPNTLDSHSRSHRSTEHSLPRKVSFWKRLIGDKGKSKEDSQYQLSRATSLSVQEEQKQPARRFRNENGIIALSSSTSESGHIYARPTEDNTDASSSLQGARRKLKKRPPSAWNPNKARARTVTPFQYALPSTPPRTPTIIPSPSSPVHRRHVSDVGHPLPTTRTSIRQQIPSISLNRHTLYDSGRPEQSYDYPAMRRSSHEISSHFQYQQQLQHQLRSPVSAVQVNGHLPLSVESLQSMTLSIPISNNTPYFPIRNVSETFSDILPPKPNFSSLRVDMPSGSTSSLHPNHALSGFARCKSAPDLTDDGHYMGLTNALYSFSYPNSNGVRPEAEVLIQSPVSTSSTYSSPLEERVSPFEAQISPFREKQYVSPVREKQLLSSPQTLLPSSDDPSLSSTRPSFLRTPSNRRWTLAVSETSENELVEELDRLRRTGWILGFQGELMKVKEEEEVRNPTTTTDLNGATTDICLRVSNANSRNAHDSSVRWKKEEMEQWLVARKALLVCREIVRTEKTYREGLETLRRGGTLDSPPPLMLQYLPALISASQAFSAKLAEDPSALGASKAFISCEEALETAFVAWSGIVGEFFGKNSGPSREAEKKEIRRVGKTRTPESGRSGRRISIGFDRIPIPISFPMMQNPTRVAVLSSKTGSQGSQVKKRNLQSQSQSKSTRLNRVSTTSLSNLQATLWRRSMPSLAFLSAHASDSGHDDGDGNNSSPDAITGSNTSNDANTAKTFNSAASSNDTISLSFLSSAKRTRKFTLGFGNGSGRNAGDVLPPSNPPVSKTKIPTVQDLAIQPVQRVVRYVLLYKDLSNSTPESSPPRALVERALEAASRIAQRCNRAQDNAAFLL